MITKIIDENSVSCIPEDSDDLIILRRVIKKEIKLLERLFVLLNRKKILQDQIRENVLRLDYH